MNTSYYGFIVGIDQYNDPQLETLQYAQKDATDIYNILTDSEIGSFPKTNVTLLLGQDARLDDIQINLIDIVVKRKDTDTVLVYFAGHAIPIDGKIYLVSSDISKSQIEINPLKYISISLDVLRENVFRASKAKNIILILDTCYSGSILPKERGGKRRDLQNQILDTLQEIQPLGEDEQIRSIIVSSGPSSISLEHSDFKNGVFTHYLLEGLRRGAVDMESGEVTIDALLNYVKKHMPKEQKPGGYSNGFGRVVLVHHSTPPVNQDAIKYFSVSEIKKLSTHPDLEPLASSLDSYQPFIQSFVEQLKNESKIDLSPEEKIVDALRLSLDVAIALVVVQQNDRWGVTIKRQRSDINSEKIIETAVPSLLAAIQAQSGNRTTDRIGSFSHLRITESSMGAIAIPVMTKNAQKVVVLLGKTETLDSFKNDLFAQIVSGIYYAIEQSQSADANLIESHLLDFLKEYNKYVPISFYERKSSLFNQRLKMMSVRFQPIIYLGMREPFVCGYEALASDPETNKTPLDLMKTSEIWGRRFKIDLDTHFFETAITTYRDRIKETQGHRRAQEILDLSINVYPESLLRTAYYSKVADILSQKNLPAYRVYLEISEKSPSPEVIPGDGIATKGVVTFRDILKKYVKDFKIGFAIDDFGIEHSSVARLADLTPSYVKIDRGLMKSSTAYEAIKFTVDFIEEIVSGRHLCSTKIVLEGFDEEMSHYLSLNRLMELGILFIQSYIIGPPTDKLVHLTPEQRERIINLIKN